MVGPKNKRNSFLLALLIVVLFVGALFGGLSNDRALALSRACQNSTACREAAAREQEANKNAAAAANSANLFQAKVNELSAEIATQEAAIAETEANIVELELQIAETEAKLAEQQDALAELLVNMHFAAEAEPIKVLAGANSISDLAEKASRNEVIKQQISLSAAEIKKAKLELEAKRAEVQNLLEQQKIAKESLVSKRAEQQALVIKYENDAEAYATAARQAQEAQREAERAEQEAHPELYRGSAYTGANTYPWQADCPERQDEYTTWYDNHKIGGYVCECVSYAGWKAYEAYGVALAWGNAYSWDDGARAAGYRVDHNAAPGTIGQVDGYPYGHVFWVESVNADGSINVSEYNNSYATYLYSGISRYGDFGSRTIAARDLWQYNFIHF